MEKKNSYELKALNLKKDNKVVDNKMYNKTNDKAMYKKNANKKKNCK